MEFYQIILLIFFLITCAAITFVILVICTALVKSFLAEIRHDKKLREEELPEAECSKCGSKKLYIACPDHCYECYEKFEWHRTDKLTPPHKVVLAAWYSYDSGWVKTTAWWDKDKNIWMDKGENLTESSGIYYSHWRLVPEGPMDKEFEDAQHKKWNGG